MHPYSKEMRKFCLADKTVNSFVIAVYMPMMCWRNGVLVNWKNDDLFSNVESYNDMTQKVYTKLMELNTRSYKIVTKDGKDFNNLSPGWKTAILLDLILGYEQDTAPIIIDQPEDNLAVKYINSTLTETIKAVKWSKQVIMVSHNATIPMMADAQTIVVCENDGNKITIRSASLESEVFGQKVLEYIADQTDGGRTSIKKRVKKYNFKKYN